MILHIDIETYSSEDLKKAGVYKYTQSVDFEILLVAYAFNDEPIKVVDLAAGEELPPLFIRALQDPEVKKMAHNATFERLAFRALGYEVPPQQWFCTMVKAAYHGLPLSLEKLSEVLKLGDKSKLSTGKALIRYFCLPCKPTKANGGRFRNLPEHDTDKWEEFKTYCAGDVEAEREIENLLKKYSFPVQETINYNLDQKINDAGVLVDTELAAQAIAIDSRFSHTINEKIKNITGVDNPGSAAQLKKWLTEAIDQEIKTLAKTAIPELIEQAGPGPIADVLELRQQNSKTSIKKYDAMLNAAGEDGRARGLFQFYGANRTGRWAGRLIQLQNLPQNHLSDLDGARQQVKTGDYDGLEFNYGNVSEVLSQLIRTAFVAPKGKILAVSDYSAIEARIIAWLAGEKWRLEVFATHGKIYEASAALMFGMPIESITKGSALRQKGKIAELALGYQGGVGALKTMGGESMGLSVDEMTGIVGRWREKNPAIVALWADLDKNAKLAISNKGNKFLSNNGRISFYCDPNFLIITLPSGRSLYYFKARFGVNSFGGKSIKYQSLDQQTKQWGWVDTYGGKIAENVVQGIARDILAESMARLDSKGYKIIMHVHDELVAEIDKQNADLEKITSVMGERVSWAADLPLPAEGYLTEYYKKD